MSNDNNRSNYSDNVSRSLSEKSGKNEYSSKITFNNRGVVTGRQTNPLAPPKNGKIVITI